MSNGKRTRRDLGRSARKRHDCGHPPTDHAHGPHLTALPLPLCRDCGKRQVIVACRGCGRQAYQCSEAPVLPEMKLVVKADDFADLTQ